MPGDLQVAVSANPKVFFFFFFFFSPDSHSDPNICARFFKLDIKFWRGQGLTVSIASGVHLFLCLLTLASNINAVVEAHDSITVCIFNFFFIVFMVVQVGGSPRHWRLGLAWRPDVAPCTPPLCLIVC